MKKEIKKKKRKKSGFTLVELLAVIIILAIVVGITIPAVLTTTSNAKAKAFQTAANSIADWVDKQYQAYTSGATSDGLVTVDPTFENICFSACSGNYYSNTNDNPNNCYCDNRVVYLTENFITAAGIKANNISIETGGPDDTPKYSRNIRTKKISGIYYAMKTTYYSTETKVELNHIDFNKTRVFINPDTGRSCVTLKASSNSNDYPQGTIVCGGICQSEIITRADYCQAS